MSTTTDSLTIALPDEAATLALGARIAAGLSSGVSIYLSGDLGAGKTTFSRGLIQALGHEGRVKSPTYTLVELYVISKLNLYHFDFYRFNDPEEWNEAGFRDLFNGTNICLVEWPEKAGDLLPPADLNILLKPTPEMARTATLQSHTPRGQALITALQSAAPSNA